MEPQKVRNERLSTDSHRFAQIRETAEAGIGREVNHIRLVLSGLGGKLFPEERQKAEGRKQKWACWLVRVLGMAQRGNCPTSTLVGARNHYAEQAVAERAELAPLSDAVAIHLQNDLGRNGIVVNREVVIRRGEKPGGLGERTDIYVDAVCRGAGGEYDYVAVIIEAKGCWNSLLDTAMEIQLCKRYMADNRCQHGIYLVGWFVCPQWDKHDSRQTAKLRNTGIDDARQQLDAQALQLTTQGRVIRAVIVNAMLR